MPLRHSPPRTSPAAKATLSQCISDPNISKAGSTLSIPDIPNEQYLSDSNIAIRKRKRGGDDHISEQVMRMFQQLREEQDEKFDALMNKVQSGFNTSSEQNSQINIAIDFLSNKYDEALLRIKSLEEEKASDRNYARILESRLDAMERSMQSSCIEVRNVPKKTGETKEDLLNIVQNVGTALNVPMTASEIQDVYRINTKNENSQPIVARLCTVTLRDKIVRSVKDYNRKYITNKFSTANLKLAGPQRPIFVSESLTIQAKKLFFMAREFAKGKDYKYCWASRGKIYLRKSDGAPAVRVNNEGDLENLRKK